MTQPIALTDYLPRTTVTDLNRGGAKVGALVTRPVTWEISEVPDS
jgi:hypothetical protein